jgi:hypothetical protein
MGLKASDKNLIPLCLRHHIMLHKRGNELAFFSEIMGNENHGKETAESIWQISPYQEDIE